jgi:hypothetical protein
MQFAIFYAPSELFLSKNRKIIFEGKGKKGNVFTRTFSVDGWWERVRWNATK